MCRSYGDQFENLVKDKLDITSYLKKQLELRNVQVFDLNDRLIGLQQAKDYERELFEKDLQSWKEKYRFETEKLENENVLLKTRLAALEEFEYQRQALENTIAELNRLMLEKEDAYKQALDQMEIAIIMFKNRLKKEAIDYLNDLAIEFHNSTKFQISNSIKQAIRENVYLHNQIDYLSNQLEKSISQNKKHIKDNEHLTRTVAILEDVEMESAKKRVATDFIVRALKNKLKESKQQQYATNENIRLPKEVEKMPTTNVDNVEIIPIPNNESNEKDNLKEENQLLRDIIEQAAIVIANAVESNNDSDEMLKSELRNDLLERLLSILLASHHLGRNGLQFSRRKSFQGIFPGSRLGLNRIHRDSATKMNTHYRPGDLGIIPHESTLESKE